MRIIKLFVRDIYLDLLLYFIFFIYTLRHFDDETTRQVVGLVLAILFASLWILARINLGSAFSPKAKPIAGEIVKKGLYSRIKHPIYLFSTLSFLSLLFILNSKPLYLSGVFLLLIQIYRTRLENRKLKELFSVQFEDYKHKVWL